jgi:uncharacterized membrane protein YcaP (DUF421 family)
MIFDNWSSIGRTLVLGVLAYTALVLVLRVSGKRTLAKMNAFDFVVTVALGSTLATILLSKDVALLTGIAALALLITLQYLVAWSSVRWAFVRRLVRSEPRLLVRRGEMLEKAMSEERVARDEVYAAIRSAGVAGVHEVDALILETNGTFSVVRSASTGDTALQPVRGYPDSQSVKQKASNIPPLGR